MKNRENSGTVFEMLASPTNIAATMKKKGGEAPGNSKIYCPVHPHHIVSFHIYTSLHAH